MIEIALNKVNKNYGFNNLLTDVSFEVKTNERVALIGSNGCGKTTTLKLISGQEEIDSGNIFIRKESSIGYLNQIPPLYNKNETGNDIYLKGIKEILELEKEINEFSSQMKDTQKDINYLSTLQEKYRIKGGYEIKGKIEKIKHGFKLTESMLNTPYNNLSGGEKTIINLASLILSNPDILLLDEPTNHLDIETLEWFEEYLNNYKGTVLIVSHDRYFLDRVINKIICLEDGKSDIYHGNYSYYVEESENRFIRQFQKYKNQQKEIKAIKEAIKRLKEWGERSDNPMFFRRAASMEKRLEKMELVDKPKEKSELKLNLNIDKRSANHVLTIENLNLEIAGKELLVNSNMSVYHNQRVCLMGKNGTGKTTLVKNILNNTHENIKIGANTIIGYIPQEIRFEDENLTIYEHCRTFFIGNEAELRSKLYKFYFNEEAISKKLNKLSGGEKVRIKLLELILKNSNFLILDEPTNHIDVDTREILEESLLNFPGTILFISHDRYFINKIATKIVRIENKKLVTYNSSYDEIKNKQVINNEIKEIKQVVNIKASNRINEFVKDSTSIELVTNSKNTKVYKIRKKSKIFYLKESNHLSRESIKQDYLKDRISIPEKMFYEKYQGKSYILTKEIRGNLLNNLDDKNKTLEILIELFNQIYSIDYKDCMIDETIDTKIKRIEEDIKNIELSSELKQKFITKENLIKYLKGNKPKQIIGFTIGNIDFKNIIYENNDFKGIINVSESGLSDIYYDLVYCEKSIEENLGKEYVQLFYDNIGIEKDDIKSEYYKIIIELQNKKA